MRLRDSIKLIEKILANCYSKYDYDSFVTFS